MNSQEIYDKTSELTGQTRQQLSVLLAETQRAGLIERNKNSRYEITDQGEDWVAVNLVHEPVDKPVTETISEEEFIQHVDEIKQRAAATTQNSIEKEMDRNMGTTVPLKKLEKDPPPISVSTHWTQPTTSIPDAMPDRHTIAELQHIQQLAQQQLDQLALQKDDVLLVAQALIDIRNACQELTQ
jgi:DNA-binding PadR family transcriptional regulator